MTTLKDAHETCKRLLKALDGFGEICAKVRDGTLSNDPALRTVDDLVEEIGRETSNAERELSRYLPALAAGNSEGVSWNRERAASMHELVLIWGRRVIDLGWTHATLAKFCGMYYQKGAIEPDWDRVVDEAPELRDDLFCFGGLFYTRGIEVKLDLEYAWAAERDPLSTLPKLKLNDFERNVLEALGSRTLVTDDLLQRAGYENASYARGRLAAMARHRILEHTAERGYSRGPFADHVER